MSSHPTYADNRKRRLSGAIETQCPQCKILKPRTREFFSASKTRPDGLVSWCKTCAAEEKRRNRKANPEHWSAIEKARHLRHGERRNAHSRLKWAINGPTYLKNSKQRRAQKAIQYEAARRAKIALHPERARAIRAAYYERNRDRIISQMRARWAIADTRKRLRTYMGANISHSLARRAKAGRGWQTLLGYTTADLVRHLERQFVRGMTWENYGKEWHVDHILPVSMFTFTKPEDEGFHACWAITNLRPLWKDVNQQKHNTRTLLI